MVIAKYIIGYARNEYNKILRIFLMFY